MMEMAPVLATVLPPVESYSWAVAVVVVDPLLVESLLEWRHC